jgi:transcriptional regulator with XRE-family HTH domain
VGAFRPAEAKEIFTMGKLLAESLTTARLEKVMSHDDVAKAAGLSHTHVYRIFNGLREPSRRVLKSFCGILGLNINEMLRLQAMDVDFEDMSTETLAEKDTRSEQELREAIGKYVSGLPKEHLVPLLYLLDGYFGNTPRKPGGD